MFFKGCGRRRNIGITLNALRDVEHILGTTGTLHDICEETAVVQLHHGEGS